jgi:hypothetical protein
VVIPKNDSDRKSANKDELGGAGFNSVDVALIVSKLDDFMKKQVANFGSIVNKNNVFIQYLLTGPSS